MGFFQRLGLAIKIFFSKKEAVRLLAAPADESPESADPPKLEGVGGHAVHPLRLDEAEKRGALHLLSVLQRDGRFLDFIDEDMSVYSDGEIGAAARAVHSGCKSSIEKYISFSPLRTEPEDTKITISAGFDPAAVRLTGNVQGQAPYVGTLVHAGWRATDVQLPQRSMEADALVLAPAEIEL